MLGNWQLCKSAIVGEYFGRRWTGATESVGMIIEGTPRVADIQIGPVLSPQLTEQARQWGMHLVEIKSTYVSRWRTRHALAALLFGR
jgi:hypothetical protein